MRFRGVLILKSGSISPRITTLPVRALVRFAVRVRGYYATGGVWRNNRQMFSRKVDLYYEREKKKRNIVTHSHKKTCMVALPAH